MAASATPDPSIFLAVGLLSAAGSTAKSNASIGVWRRAQIRSAFTVFAAGGGHGVALRFLLAPAALIPASDPTSVAVPPALRREAAERRDLIFLNMTEGLYRCTQKYLDWLALAPKLFPAAQFFALGDDDIFLSVAHLEADLRGVAAATRPLEEHILYGLIMWKAYFNNRTLATHTGFASWDFFDWSAVAQRRTMRKCRAAMARRELRRRAASRQGERPTLPATVSSSTLLSSSEAATVAAAWLDPSASSVRSGGDMDEMLPGIDLYPYQKSDRSVRKLPAACALIRKDHMQAALTSAVDALPPFPYIDGPLFAVSAALGAALVAQPTPRRYLEALAALYAGATQKIYGVSCWPTTDSIFGYWTAATAAALGQHVTLVNSPQHLQHLPWPSWKFSNKTIVMHGVRSPKNERFRAHAAKYGAGPFEPYERECAGCAEMGWVTWPDSPLRSWRCCGRRVPRNGSRLKACTGVACPDVRVSVLRAVYHGGGDLPMHEYEARSRVKRKGRAG